MALNENNYENVFDMQLVDELIVAVNNIVKNKVEKMINQSNVEMCWSGIIKSINTSTNLAKVELPFDTIIDDVPNLSGQTIGVNDRVKIYADHMNMVDCYIGTVYK